MPPVVSADRADTYTGDEPALEDKEQRDDRVGFDDIEAASLVRPRLTTVSNRAREHGQVCARLLLDRLAGEYRGAGRAVLIPTDLVLRESA